MDVQKTQEGQGNLGMKLSKAIEIKARTGEEFLSTDPDEIDEAERLSIEAMKAIQRHRHTNMPAAFIVLEGETPEEEPKRR